MALLLAGAGLRISGEQDSSKEGTMKPARTVAVVFLVLLAIVQACRLLFSWSVNVNGIAVPLWASGVALVVVLTIAVALWREAR